MVRNEGSFLRFFQITLDNFRQDRILSAFEVYQLRSLDFLNPYLQPSANLSNKDQDKSLFNTSLLINL